MITIAVSIHILYTTVLWEELPNGKLIRSRAARSLVSGKKTDSINHMKLI